VFTTSFGLEDQVLTHLLAGRETDIGFVTLDTGRLFPETYRLWAETERRYGIRVRAFFPRTEDLEALVNRDGIAGFTQSREARLSCCHVRKVEPLNRALSGARGWITGLRAEQSAERPGRHPARVGRSASTLLMASAIARSRLSRRTQGARAAGC